jgi:acyl-CoA thioester hydrolase
VDLLSARVEPSWIDYNGHMNVAYYHMAFDRATDVFLESIGLGEEYLKHENGSMFALEDHLTYQREIRQGEPFRIALQLLAADAKRIHYFLRMIHGETGHLVATCEHLSIFVDMSARRSAPLPEPVRAKVASILAEHRSLSRPEEVGRPMRVEE